MARISHPSKRSHIYDSGKIFDCHVNTEAQFYWDKPLEKLYVLIF